MRTAGITISLIISLLAAVLYQVRGDAASSSNTPLQLAPCHLESLAEEVRCGVLEVFEDRDRGRGRRIPIHFAVLKALRRSAAADPLFILAGGPGQGARGYAGLVARTLKAVRRTRDIVLVDLRGTGASAALECHTTAEYGTTLQNIGDQSPDGGDPGRDVFFGEGQRCLAALGGDPRFYTHRNALADLDAIRARLGYRLVNLWGGSWGTRAALIYALRFPTAVRRVVLDGAASLDMQFPRTAAADAQRAFDLLVERCAQDPVCARTFPDPHGRLRLLLERLAAAPVEVRIRHPRTARTTAVRLTRDVVAETVRVALYTPADAARVLHVVYAASDGDFAPLAAQHVYSASVSIEDMALGSTMAILCSEDIPFVSGADFASDARGSFLGTSYAHGWLARCRDWPAGAPIEVDRSARSNAPALILSGLHDPVTPPRAGEAMARWFRTHEHVVVPGAAHNTSFAGCLPDIIARFLDAAPIDAACANDVPLPPIVTSFAGGRP